MESGDSYSAYSGTIRDIRFLDESEEEMFRKCAVFYSAIGAEQPPKRFELDNIRKMSFQQIKRDLDPVLRKGE